MKKYRLIIAIAVLVANLSAVTAWGQTTRWLITSGPGKGVLLEGNGGFIFDPLWQADGHVAAPDECSCVHYHGVLFDRDDPNPNGCGWGCVIRVPATPAEALGDLLLAINNTAAFDPALAVKLKSILDTAVSAASNNCNTLFLGAADAIADELVGLFAGQPSTLEQYDLVIKQLVTYAVRALDAIDPGITPTNEPCCKITLLRKHGSTSQAKLFDAKRKINADVGEVIALDVETCPKGGAVIWDYKFMGQAAGALPRGAGVSFTTKRLCVLSERPTTVTVTASFVCPNGRKVKDTVTISIQ